MVKDMLNLGDGDCKVFSPHSKWEACSGVFTISWLLGEDLLIYFQTHNDFDCEDYESHVDNNGDVSVISVDDEIDDYEYDACFV